MSHKKTPMVTGAEQAIGASRVQGFLKDSHNVVATSLKATGSFDRFVPPDSCARRHSQPGDRHESRGRRNRRLRNHRHPR